MTAPVVLVSACLAGHRCRYDGRDNAVQRLVELAEHGLCLPVCPEVLGNLPIPRIPCELQGGRVVGRNGADFTEAFRLGAAKALAQAKAFGLDAAILKSRSPSCGSGKVYDGTFSRRLVPGDGIFAALLKERGFRIRSEEDFSDFLELLEI